MRGDKKVIIITSLSEKETDKRKELEKLELRFIFLKVHPEQSFKKKILQ